MSVTLTLLFLVLTTLFVFVFCCCCSINKYVLFLILTTTLCLFVSLLFSQSHGGSIEVHDTDIRRLLKHIEILTVHTYTFRTAIKWIGIGV